MLPVRPHPKEQQLAHRAVLITSLDETYFPTPMMNKNNFMRGSTVLVRWYFLTYRHGRYQPYRHSTLCTVERDPMRVPEPR